MTNLVNATLTVAVIVASLLVFSGQAYAHERRIVGPYQLVVGWLTEPAYTGAPNGLDLRVTDTRTSVAVEGLEKTLSATVAAGGVMPLSLTMTARFGTPGAYSGHFVPTVAGSYAFNIKGKIGTLDVDERFESGPGRFDDIQSTIALQYPVKVPEPEEVGARLGAIQSSADLAKIIALAALVLGIVGIGIGVALTASRRRT